MPCSIPRQVFPQGCTLSCCWRSPLSQFCSQPPPWHCPSCPQKQLEQNRMWSLICHISASPVSGPTHWIVIWDLRHSPRIWMFILRGFRLWRIVFISTALPFEVPLLFFMKNASRLQLQTEASQISSGVIWKQDHSGCSAGIGQRLCSLCWRWPLAERSPSAEAWGF